MEPTIKKLLKLCDQLTARGNVEVAEKIRKLAQGVPNPIKDNHDYGEGLYHGEMKRFKSVKEFLDKRKKKKKEVQEPLN